MYEVKLYNSPDVVIRIKSRAKEKDIAIKDMLVAIGLGINTLSHMNHGKAIAFDSLARIADYLECSVDYLLGRTPEPSIDKKKSPAADLQGCPGTVLMEYYQKMTQEGKDRLMEQAEWFYSKYRDSSQFSAAARGKAGMYTSSTPDDRDDVTTGLAASAAQDQKQTEEF